MKYLVLAVLLFSIFPGCGKKDYLNESVADRDERMEWWNDAKFGMFIHWGAYSVPAGWYKDKMVSGASEWIMDAAKIPIDEYEKFSKQFNPTEYDAEEWVRIAKNAGMKYIIITSKHHDGYCIWDSKVTNYDIVDFSPYKKDLLKPLAEACRKEGIKFGFYHSIMDWHHPDANKEKFKKYRDEYLIPQLVELLEEYEDLAVLWFDGEWIDEWTEEQGKSLYNQLRNISPDILINNRIGKGRDGMQGMNKDSSAVGDFGTPEQEILEKSSSLPWEACMTFNDSWGFKKGDDNWKSAEALIFNIIDIVSKGGNYLLNVGPDSRGIIPNESVTRLGEIGNWMNINGEAIYNTRAIKNYFEGEKIRYTKAKDDDIYYSFILNPAKSLEVMLKNILPIENSKIYIIGDDNPVSYKSSDLETKIIIPQKYRANNFPIVLKIIGIENKVVEKPLITIDDVEVENTYLFQNDIKIKLNSLTPHSIIRYTIDGSEPNEKSKIFKNELLISETSVIKSSGFKNGFVKSPTTKIKLHKIKSVKDIIIKNHPSEKYSGYGKLTLINGQRGGSNYQNKDWLGFEGEDLEVLLDLGESKHVNEVSLGCLSNLNSWIFLPQIVSFYTASAIGKYEKVHEFNYQLDKNESIKGFIKDISAKVNNSVRYIKIVAENINQCPSWHKGKGGKAWIFADEIIIN